MRLHSIIENIEKTDFFDFYALLQANDDQTHSSPTVKSYLEFYANRILDDHLHQFGRMLINRLPDSKHQATREIMNQYGLTFDDWRVLGIDKLQTPEMAALVNDLLNLDNHHGFTGETWHGLGAEFIKLSNTKPDLRSRIMAVDKLYNLMHHGGQITDFMDESDWLEDALNLRDSANPAQIFALASPDVRSIIGRPTYQGMDRTPVSDMAKLYTALRRVATNKDGIDISYANDKIIANIIFSRILLNGDTIGNAVYGNKPTAFQTRLLTRPDMGIKLSPKQRATISAKDEDGKIIISNKWSSVEVHKPINRQYQLADDMISAAVGTANGTKLEIGGGTIRIKESYYYQDKRRIGTHPEYPLE